MGDHHVMRRVDKLADKKMVKRRLIAPPDRDKGRNHKFLDRCENVIVTKKFITTNLTGKI